MINYLTKTKKNKLTRFYKDKNDMIFTEQTMKEVIVVLFSENIFVLLPNILLILFGL